MTRFLLLTVLAVTLSSCTRQTGSQPSASKVTESNNRGKTAKQKRGMVTIGKPEQDTAHIVLGTIQQQNVAQTVTAPGKMVANGDRT